MMQLVFAQCNDGVMVCWAGVLPPCGPHVPTQDNVGFKLIQKMGWKSGTGLGKHEQGQSAPHGLISQLYIVRRKCPHMGDKILTM